MKFTHRPGISLLEVLISMFVLVIGLLGVAAMFPVGQSYVFKAAQYDRSAALGQAAFNEIQVRGMLRMDANRPFDYWLRPDSSSDPPVGANPFVPGMPPVPNGAVDLRGIAFAIDPLACATNVAEGGTANLTNFPAFPPTGAVGPRLTRATLFARRDVAAGRIVALSRAVAEQLFMSHDELTIELPSDRDTPAIQPLNATGTKRQFQGDYSWLFTVVPALEMGREDLYTVSVVVFHKRILPTDPNDPQPPERMVQISSMSEGKLLGGWGGGDAQLTSPNSLLIDGIRTGQWCLLSAWLNNDPTINMPIFKWYRIVSVEKEVQAEQAGFTRWVTLAGPDWDPRLTTSVSLFDGAIAVYEKTMRIEAASLYGGP
jgi:hypothetical protein